MLPHIEGQVAATAISVVVYRWFCRRNSKPICPLTVCRDGLQQISESIVPSAFDHQRALHPLRREELRVCIHGYHHSTIRSRRNLPSVM